MNQVFNTTSFIRSFRREKVALGNSQPRYNSHVEGIRKKYFINSMRSSQEIPEWMSRTQRHFLKSNPKTHSMHINNQSSFVKINQSNTYENKPKVENKGGQFHRISRKKMRSHWQMKNHTFQIEWPKPQQKKQKVVVPYSHRTAHRTGFFDNPQFVPTQTTRQYSFHLPKYGIRQSPLHVQKTTPIKIGHTAVIDTYLVK